MKSNLRRRKILVDPICDECHSMEEDILHVVWNCPVSHQSWNNSPIINKVMINRPSSFKDLLILILDTPSEELQCLFAIQAWLLWFRCNKGQAKNVWDEVSSIPQRATHLFQDYSLLPRTTTPNTHPKPRIKWSPPLRGKWKINFDGAFSEDSQMAGIGVVVRDQTGSARACLT